MAGAGAGVLAAVLAAAGCIVAAKKRSAAVDADTADSYHESLVPTARSLRTSEPADV